ncbi:MAG: hypothetical protein J6Y87_02305 [Muribaculaceae bacterium]|nr:hypothetical protein [Muribaculaceae bacterium]
MKSTFLAKATAITVALLTTVGVAAQPKLCGHRGSLWGVENTSEAFINGALKGYTYLECDVKVSKDGYHVISHDDTTNRLGGSLTIASATLAELKAETYTQTRGGVTYTGKICTLEEYLDICTQYGVHPLIELKWATGINSNDTSGIPKLISVIESKGHRNDCIILTSMKPCLEKIRTLYPDITLQFLTGQYWANHFDWCVQWGIDADIEGGYFDKATVKQYHDAGLKVGVWTVDTQSGYKTYGNYGCDFITTNSLDPATLPELDPEITFPPNTVDYPETEGKVRGFYDIVEVGSVFVDNALIGHDLSGALFRNGKMFVVINPDSHSSEIAVVDTSTGERLASPSVPEGKQIRAIAFAADGSLLISTTPDSAWRLYRHDLTTATTSLYAEIDLATIGSDVTSFGSVFSVSGKPSELYVFSLDNIDGASTLSGMTLKSGVLSGAIVRKAVAADASLPILVTPTNRCNILTHNAVSPMVEYTLDLEDQSLATYSTFNDNADMVSPIAFTRLATKPYAVVVATDGHGSHGCQLLDISGSIANAKAVSRDLPEGLIMNQIEAVGCEVIDGEIVIYALTDSGRIYTFESKTEEEDPGNTGATDFVLEKVWERSNVEGNAPSDLGGDAARQGAVVDGKFYVNDRDNKIIHIFDETGHLGTINGGAGWGIAADDAGNLIVRDDPSASATHSFLIYPHGDFSATPTRVTIDCLLDGQTDFISASGNVISGFGNVYLYPKNQEAVSIITFVDGNYSVDVHPNLAMTGTAAGYVIPIDNNSENWLYQIRGTGYYEYSGGESTQYLLGRSNTTQPSRNSTGGGCRFVLSTKTILVHPSGANYKGGFTVRNMTDDNVIGNVAPIGTLGYETGGNYSTFTWLFEERVDAGTYLIYNYCPANGFCVYRLTDRNYVGSAEMTEADSKVVSTSYYNLQGIAIARPISGQVVIAVDHLSDGSIRASKIITK